jgi:hypothetical protein
VGYVKRYNGSSWVDINPKRWNGSSWVDVEVYKYDGSKWVNISSQQYTTTWEATWTQTYRESGTKRTDYRSEKLCQGEYVSEPWGIMRSLCGFGDIESALQGAKINKVELYLHNEHWYYNSGGTAVIGYHNHATVPNTFSHSKYGAKYQNFSSRGQALWITMPNELGEGIRDGIYKGISIFANTSNLNYYGIFYGANDGSRKPKLKITYTK